MLGSELEVDIARFFRRPFLVPLYSSSSRAKQRDDDDECVYVCVCYMETDADAWTYANWLSFPHFFVTRSWSME